MAISLVLNVPAQNISGQAIKAYFTCWAIVSFNHSFSNQHRLVKVDLNIAIRRLYPIDWFFATTKAHYGKTGP